LLHKINKLLKDIRLNFAQAEEYLTEILIDTGFFSRPSKLNSQSNYFFTATLSFRVQAHSFAPWKGVLVATKIKGTKERKKICV